MWREAAFLIERRITGWIIQGTSASVFAELEEKSHPFSPLMSSAMKKHTDKGLTIAIDSFHWYMLSCFILSLCSLNNKTWLCSNPGSLCEILQILHDDVIKWKHFPRYWPFVRGTHRSPVNSPHKGQWSGVFMFCLISAWMNGWVNNRVADDWRRHRDHYDVTVMDTLNSCIFFTSCCGLGTGRF